jgi:hypothetical protein
MIVSPSSWLIPNPLRISPLPAMASSAGTIAMVPVVRGAATTTSTAWPLIMVQKLAQGVPLRSIKVPQLARVLSTLPPPTWRLTLGGDRATEDAELERLFQALRETPIEVCAPLQVPDCGNLYIARGSSKDSVKHCPVLQHLVQRPGDLGTATNLLSNMFVEDLRLAAVSVRSHEDQSPAQYWRTHTQKVLEAAMKVAKVRKRRTQLQLEDLAAALFWQAPSCQGFRPQVAMHFMQAAAKVLDPCGGWGDRLLAALAAGVADYVVVDPEEELHMRYKAMAATFDGADTTTVHAEPFCYEDIPLPADDADKVYATNAVAPFDLVFTSPPFFDREIYSDSASQSSTRYKTLQAWCSQFLLPMLRNSAVRLRVGGIMAIAMADYVVHDADKGTRSVRFTADMIAELGRGEPAVAFLGVVEFSRLTSKGTTKRRPQPVFVWQRLAKRGAAAEVPAWLAAPPTERPCKRTRTACGAMT